MYTENNSELMDLDLKDIIHTHVPNLDECLSEFLDSIFENEVLKNMENNKSPRSDGYTVEFFKFYWFNLKEFMIKSIVNCK